MHVHLITVEVGVVGRGDRQVEAESGVGQDAHAVAHHTHFVQRGLTVEEHQVSVMQVALHLQAHVGRSKVFSIKLISMSDGVEWLLTSRWDWHTL
eukprot:scaffold164447_cov19-Tisochrysis_lutea.AAC.1